MRFGSWGRSAVACSAFADSPVRAARCPAGAVLSVKHARGTGVKTGSRLREICGAGQINTPVIFERPDGCPRNYKLVFSRRWDGESPEFPADRL